MGELPLIIVMILLIVLLLTLTHWIQNTSLQLKTLRRSVTSIEQRLCELERHLPENEPAESAPHMSPAPISSPPTPVTPESDAPDIRRGDTPMRLAHNETPPWWNSFPSMQDLEQRAGQRWMTWLGAGALAIGIIFLIKYSFERGWAGPAVRLTGGVALGIALQGLGVWANRRRYAPFAQGLMACGLAICQASLFAAFRFHDLLPQPVAFAAMVFFTILGMGTAVLYDFLAFAILALIGGFLAPILLSTGHDGRDTLFAYVLLLDLGVLGILHYRSWRWLDLVAFLGTAFLYTSWFDAYYTSAAMGPAFAWLGALYGLFALTPLFTFWRHDGKLPADRLVTAALNAGFALLFAAAILWAEHRSSLAGVAVLMAFLYAILARMASLQGERSQSFVLSHTALAVTLLTIAVPIYFSLDTISLVWGMEACLLVYLGLVYQYPALRRLATGVLTLALLRGLEAIFSVPESVSIPLFHRDFAHALIAPTAAALFAYLLDRHRLLLDQWDQAACAAAGIVSGILALLAASYDVIHWLTHQGQLTSQTSRYWYYSMAFAVTLWSMAALLYFCFGRLRRSNAVAWTGVCLAIFAAGISLFFLIDPARHRYIPFLRFPSVSLCVATLAVIAYWMTKVQLTDGLDPESFLYLLFTTALGLFWLLLTVETHAHFLNWFGSDPWGRQIALSAVTVAWAGYGISLVALGFAKSIRWLRLVGLAVFGVTAGKVVFVDLSQLEDLTRVAAFVGIGLLMIAASYLYHRLEQRLIAR